MGQPRSRRRLTWINLSVLVVLGVAAGLTSAHAPAQALTDFDPSGPLTGNATWFFGLGGPYGGCGMTQDALETEHFVALNVYDTPGDSTFYNRPMADSVADKMGMWNNGHNCGRWVRVTIGDYCTGTNDGALGQPFCRNGSWVADEYNGATLDMIVADSCGDSNSWCRDDPYHLDLSRHSLNQFQLDGVPVGDMDPDSWNNRHISWEFIEAPDYTGDIQIGFLQSAQTYWSAIAVSRLPNGIHGVESYSDGAWVDAEMDGDMGQAYIIEPLVPGGTDYSIRVRDVTDTLINDGRVYNFSMPQSCGSSCPTAYTEVDYTASTEPTAPTDPTDPGDGDAARTCTATYETVNTWPGGFQGRVTVTAGTAAITGWTVSWDLADDQSIGSSWNGTLTTSGSTVTAKNAYYNAAVAAGTSTTFGFVSSGSPTTPTFTCSTP
jgi:hypothetical protein